MECKKHGCQYVQATPHGSAIYCPMCEDEKTYTTITTLEAENAALRQSLRATANAYGDLATDNAKLQAALDKCPELIGKQNGRLARQVERLKDALSSIANTQLPRLELSKVQYGGMELARVYEEIALAALQPKKGE